MLNSKSQKKWIGRKLYDCTNGINNSTVEQKLSSPTRMQLWEELNYLLFGSERTIKSYFLKLPIDVLETHTNLLQKMVLGKPAKIIFANA